VIDVNRAILMCGTDDLLLQVRGKVLEGAGFEVDLAKRPSEAQLLLGEESGRYGLMLVCHSTPMEARSIVHCLADRDGVSFFQLDMLVDPAELIREVSRRLAA
jgi:hypothetical protein